MKGTERRSDVGKEGQKERKKDMQVRERWKEREGECTEEIQE